MHLSRSQLTSVLLDLIEKVHKGDSLEGTFSYALLGATPPSSGLYEVTAAYRIGNLEGQGYVRSIHAHQAPDATPPSAPVGIPPEKAPVPKTVVKASPQAKPRLPKKTKKG